MHNYNRCLIDFLQKSYRYIDAFVVNSHLIKGAMYAYGASSLRPCCIAWYEMKAGAASRDRENNWADNKQQPNSIRHDSRPISNAITESGVVCRKKDGRQSIDNLTAWDDSFSPAHRCSTSI